MAMVILPFSGSMLFLLLCPVTPLSVLIKLTHWLWELELRISTSRIKVIHFAIILFLFVFIGKTYSLSGLNEERSEHYEVTLDVTYRMSRNRAERDFYLFGMNLMIWIYIWRLCPIVYSAAQEVLLQQMEKDEVAKDPVAKKED